MESLNYISKQEHKLAQYYMRFKLAQYYMRFNMRFNIPKLVILKHKLVPKQTSVATLIWSVFLEDLSPTQVATCSYSYRHRS